MGSRVDDVAVELLGFLRNNPERFITIQKLAEKFSTRPKIINEALRGLAVWGYKFDFDATSKVKFASAPDSIFPHEIDYYLKTKFIGRNIISHFSVPSTNTLAFDLANDGVPEGTLVIAEKQTSGRGRLGRGWYSPPKKGLWISIILRPTLPPAELPGLSIVAVAALTETIVSKLKLEAKVKWPNDCLIDGVKVAGILTELSAELDRANHVVVGIGINVNHTTKDFPPWLRRKATSLKIETGNSIDRIPFLAEFLFVFEKMYIQFKKHGLKPLLPKIKKRSYLLGKQVRLKKGKKIIIAKAVDIDLDGALLVKRRSETLRVTAGEVTVI